jgi:hypothetical protein
MVGLLAGCERTPEDVEKWRDAQGGMDKMMEWAASSEESTAVRKKAVRILVEEGEANRLQPLFDNKIKDEKTRETLANAAVPSVASLWEKGDPPKKPEKLSEKEKEKGVRIDPDDPSVLAKDAAYFLHPYATGEQQKKLETILSEWLSAGWEFRNDLGSTTLVQIAPRAGSKGIESLVSWTRETDQPDVVASKLWERSEDEKVREKIASAVRERAEKEYPELSERMQAAIFITLHEEMTPLYEKIVLEEKAPLAVIDRAIEAIEKVEGKKATMFFTKLIAEKPGDFRQLASQSLFEVRGKTGVRLAANAMPEDLEKYKHPESGKFEQTATFFCNAMKTDLAEKHDVKDIEPIVKTLLTSKQWPSQVIGLQCVREHELTGLEEQVRKLEDSDQPIPSWGEEGEEMTVGKLAGEVLSGEQEE